MTTKKPLTFDSVDAISVGGSYTVGADGKAVRNQDASTSLESIAKGAPGEAADVKGAADNGVALAHPQASTADALPTTGAKAKP